MAPQQSDGGWSTRTLGDMRGYASLSIGAQAWDDHAHIRNLIFRSAVDVAPGWRLHAIGRRREGSWSRYPFRPDIDELYAEGQTFYHGSAVDAALNLRVGRMRYLRFPEPDLLSEFDQVPGISDFLGLGQSDYRGALMTAEVSTPLGLGAHIGAMQWAFDAWQHGANVVEGYAFYRPVLPGGWLWETRLGDLALRPEPLGRSARFGASAFFGKQLGDFTVGAMIEGIHRERTYTGVMVAFRPTAVTRALGRAGFDYARNPEGIAVQYDILDVPINLHRAPPKGSVLVGEVRARRVRTYWQQSFQRNEYEHRLSSWGQAPRSGDTVVVEEQPWTLDLEALVSPNTRLGSDWFRNRQGPAQLAQDVVYRVFRPAAR